MFEQLSDHPRLRFHADLKPVYGQGHRFQPTGFADLGAAVYERPDGTRMLLVESAQSIANHLESTCLKPSSVELIDELKGLPYILVQLSGASDSQVSSLVEAHRMNSPFIIQNKEFKARFLKQSGYARDKRLNWKNIAQGVFHFDPNSILHGLFLANLDGGRIKMQRAITGFIEAEGIREAASGGVKNSFLDPTGKVRVEGFDQDVYGNVPFHRIEYVATSITAYFNLDLALISGYGFGNKAKDLLISLALYKVRRFLDTGLRLRTACDLKEIKNKADEPEGFTIPESEELLERVQRCITGCSNEGLFADPAVTILRTDTVRKKSTTT